MKGGGGSAYFIIFIVAFSLIVMSFVLGLYLIISCLEVARQPPNVG